MSRILSKFKELGLRGEGALFGYLMAGDPDLARSREYARVLMSGGTDLLGLELPFSDPMADGPILKEAGVRALWAGTTLLGIFEMIKELRQASPIPMVLRTYYNPILSMGEETFIKRCVEMGVDGLIVPDLPTEEATGLLTQARRYQVDTIFLVTPETDDERLQAIARETSGFLYVVSRDGIPLESLIRRLRSGVSPELPLAVECEISTSEQIRTILRAGAQGVIVGSALVECVASGISAESLREFVQQLKASTRPASPLPPPPPTETLSG
jgi:tryptophan synthase alpha chain